MQSLIMRFGRGFGAVTVCLFLVTITWDLSAQNVTMLFQDGFESGIGDWVVDNGLWEIGPPLAGPDSAHSGNNVAGTVLGGNYPQLANSRLISPDVPLPQAVSDERILLRFWHWFSTEDCCDIAYVQISQDHGSFETLGSVSGVGSVWTQQLIDLTAYAGSNIRIAFYFTSNTGNAVSSGWFIDDLSIEKKEFQFRNPEDFEEGIDDWHAENGLWEVGPPPKESANIDLGRWVAGTVLNANYPQLANSRLVSPPINLPMINTLLKFNYYFNTEDCCDFGVVQISSDGGNWENVATPMSGVGAVWTQYVADISRYAGTTVRLAFNFTSNTGNAVSSGWFVDNVSIGTRPFIVNNPEGFENGFSDWCVDNGVWEIGPLSVGPGGAYSGEKVAGTVLDANYPQLANSRLISPKMRLLPGSPKLRFWHWFSTEDCCDLGYVQISVNMGDWQTIGGPFSGLSLVWTQQIIDLSAYADSLVQIAWYFTSNTGGAVSTGWYVDSITVDLAPPDGDNAELVVSPLSVSFGKIEIDDRAEEAISIANRGDGTLNGTITLTGSDKDAFSLSHQTVTLAPNQTQEVTVSFMPHEVRSYGANIDISSNGGGANVPLTGSGFQPICPAPSIISITDIPNDQGKNAMVLWSRACPDTVGAEQPIQYYAVWRRADKLSVSIRKAVHISSPAVINSKVEGPENTPAEDTSYLVPRWGEIWKTGDDIWTFVGEVPAVQEPKYSLAVPTLFDSTSAGVAYSFFRVTAHTADVFDWYASATDSGYSVDNLVPTAPQNLIADLVDGFVRLSWAMNEEEDLDYYKVYRGYSSDFTLEMPIGNVADSTMFLDTDLEVGREYYYVVTGTDFSGNEGQPSNMVSVTVTSVNEGSSVPQEFSLEQNYPNPFNPETLIEYSLPRSGNVEISIFNTIGKQVRALVSENRMAGQYHVVWDGRDDSGKDIASGVYICQFRVDNRVMQFRKMLLIR